MRSRWREPAVAWLLATLVLPSDAVAEPRLWTSRNDGGRESATVRPAEDVHDALFALLVGLVDGDVFGAVDGAFLDSVITAEGGTSLPYHLIQSLRREPGGTYRHAVVRVHFHDEFKVAVPYSILGYHPGDMSSDRELVLSEWVLGDHSFRIPHADEPAHMVEVEDLRLFGIEAGRVDLDVDWWLDKLMGKKLDDVGVTGFLLFRRDGTRYGVAFGYTKGGRGRSGVFDLGADEIVFPAPREFLVMGARMRAQMEERLARVPREQASSPPGADVAGHR